MAPNFRVIEGGRDCGTGRKPIVWNRAFGPDAGALVILDHETSACLTTLAIDAGEALIGVRDVDRRSPEHDRIVAAWRAWAAAKGAPVRDERASDAATAAPQHEIAALQARRAARRGNLPPAADGLFGRLAARSARDLQGPL